MNNLKTHNSQTDNLVKAEHEARNAVCTPSAIKIEPFEIGDTIRINLPKNKKVMTYNGEIVNFNNESEGE